MTGEQADRIIELLEKQLDETVAQRQRWEEATAAAADDRNAHAIALFRANLTLLMRTGAPLGELLKGFADG